MSIILLYFFLAALDCDFDDFTSCNWNNVDTDSHDWTVLSGPTPDNPNTGPSGDYSTNGN